MEEQLERERRLEQLASTLKTVVESDALTRLVKQEAAVWAQGRQMWVLTRIFDRIGVDWHASGYQVDRG